MFPYWNIHKKGKRIDIGGANVSFLLNWLYDMGFSEAINIEIVRKCKGTGGHFRKDTGKITIPASGLNSRVISHEVFHLAYDKQKKNVLRWTRRNKFRSPKNHDECKKILGEDYNYYVKHYVAGGITLDQMPAYLLEECFAKQFEKVATYDFFYPEKKK